MTLLWERRGETTNSIEPREVRGKAGMTKKLRIAFGILGNITTVLSSLAPIPTFYRIYKRKDTENFSVLPYATTVLCNLFWAWYALPFITRQNLLLFIISAIQVVLQSVYIFLYFVYAPADRRAKTGMLVIAILVLFAMDIVITLAFLRHNKRKTFAGVIATLSSILAYAAPLSIMGLVIKTKSVEYMPFLLSLAIFCSGFTWTVYGILGPDIFVIVSDGIGFLLSTMQLILYAIYYRPPEQQVAYGSMRSVELSEEIEPEEQHRVDGSKQPNQLELDKQLAHHPWHQSEGQNPSQAPLPKIPQRTKPIQFSQHDQAVLYDDPRLPN